MTPERWLQICEILDAALELEPVEVPGFIEERCAGDDDLKINVSSLHASLMKRDTAFDIPAPEIIAQDIAQRSQQPMLKEGQCLEGRYEICEQLGEGGFAQVYKAKDKKLDDRYVAIKIFSPSPENKSDEALKRFREEARAVSSLGHPYIVTVHDIGKHGIEEEGDTPFIVTEFIDGITLRQRIKQSPIKLHEALDIAIKLTSALSSAHEKGIIHRDIKPENIMLGTKGIVKIVDFGVAKFNKKEILASESQEQARVDTKSGAIIGSNKYMSPEQLQGIRDIDERSDIWAIGVVLYEMIAGRVPFDGLNRDVVSHRVLSDEKPKPLSKYYPEITPELHRLVSKALSKKRENRYQTIHELFLDLQKLSATLKLKEFKQNPIRVFLEFISRAFRSLGEVFKPKNVEQESSPENREAKEFAEIAPTEENSETTRLANRNQPSATLRAHLIAALNWGKPHRRVLIMSSVALLLVSIFLIIFFYLGGRKETQDPNSTASRNNNANSNVSNDNSNPSTQDSVNAGALDGSSDNGTSNRKPGTEEAKNSKTRRGPTSHLVWKRNLREHQGIGLAVAFSPDGKNVASGTEDNDVRLWYTSSWKSKLLQSPLEGHDKVVTSIAFSPDSETLASSKDKNIFLWKKEDEYRKPEKLTGHSEQVNVVTFSPTEQLLASGGKDRSIILWDLQAGRQYRLEHKGEILAIAFSPDGKTLASASKEGTIRTWDLERVKDRSLLVLLHGGEFQVLCADCGEVYALAFTCDGKILVSGGGDNKIRQWDLQMKKELRQIGEHNDFVSSLAFSPDCKSLVSASGDGTMRIWDLETGDAQVLKNHTQRVNWISFSSKGMLISGSDDGTVKIWQLERG